MTISYWPLTWSEFSLIFDVIFKETIAALVLWLLPWNQEDFLSSNCWIFSNQIPVFQHLYKFPPVMVADFQFVIIYNVFFQPISEQPSQLNGYFLIDHRMDMIQYIICIFDGSMILFSLEKLQGDFWNFNSLSIFWIVSLINPRELFEPSDLRSLSYLHCIPETWYSRISRFILRYNL